MRKYIRHTDELIALQDKAIKALQQALLATQLALEVLQKDRDERGQQEQWNGQWSGQYPIPNTFPNTNPFYAPTFIPGGGWSAPMTLPTVTVTNSNGQVYDITGLKQDQDKKMWLEYEQSKAAANVNSGSSGIALGYNVYTKVN